MNTEEEVILVMSLLFDKNILSFFDNNKQAKMLKAKEEFLNLNIQDKNKYLQ